MHARLTEGPLGAFTRDERQSRETDKLAEALELALTLSCRGFTCWVYGHQHVVHERDGALVRTHYRCDTEIQWELVAEFDPGGRRVR